MPFWADLYKLFTYAFQSDPLTTLNNKRSVEGAAVTQPDAIPDIRGSDGFWGGGRGSIRLRDSNDFIDLSSVTNRQSRCKEYERLRVVPEIEMALSVFSDETCIAGSTPITTPFGCFTIEELSKQKPPGERFMVYSFDFKQMDWTIGWAHTPRMTKVAKTVNVVTSDGKNFVATPDHRVLLRDGNWVRAGDIKVGDELMPFHRVLASQQLSELRHGQFPRIYSIQDGWKHERQFLDEWRAGKKISKFERVNKIIRLVSNGMPVSQVATIVGVESPTCYNDLKAYGISVNEINYLTKRYEDRKRVIGVHSYKEMPVYDMSVDDLENFASDAFCFHNCQVGENGRMFDIKVKDPYIKQEAEVLMHEVLEIEDHLLSDVKNLYLMGDLFYEIGISQSNPKAGILKLLRIPADTMFRIESVKGKLLEFQQSREGPDYNALTRADVTQATEAELNTTSAIRFSPNQIIHIKIGDDRKTFYPYGVSLIEAARGPAHQLRLIEDAMVVYRLTRSVERRVFYIDTGQLPPYKAEALVERMKDQFRKRKVHVNRGSGPSSVEERWHPPAVDEDIFMPLRTGSQSRIDTLPGGASLSEIDDALYFRNKLFVAMNFPKNYAGQEDPQQTRITLSSQDVKFAKLIERLQKSIAKGLKEIICRHLELVGYPLDRWSDLQVKMTPPSEWRELSRQEINEARYNRAAAMKGAQLMSDYDIFVDILKVDKDKAKEYVARMKDQKLEDLKLQLMGQNPTLLGLGQPPSDSQEIGTDATGPSPQLAPQQQQEEPPQEDQAQGQEGQGGEEEQPPQQSTLPDPTEDDIEKYDLAIKDYSKEIDVEEVDTAELGE
jgi:hypothetical protein